MPNWLVPREPRGRSDPGKGASNDDRTYRVHARSECVLCHNPWVEKKTTAFGIQSASPLGVNTAQMNKPQSDPSQGEPAHCHCMRRGCCRGRPTCESCRAWSIRTTNRPISIAAHDPICRPTARIATSSTPAAPRRSRWDSRSRWRRRRRSGFDRSRGHSASPVR